MVRLHRTGRRKGFEIRFLKIAPDQSDRVTPSHVPKVVAIASQISLVGCSPPAPRRTLLPSVIEEVRMKVLVNQLQIGLGEPSEVHQPGHPGYDYRVWRPLHLRWLR